MKNLLAERMSLIDASGIRKVFALGATMKDPVNFSIGQPDFDVPEEVKAAAIEAIQRGFNSYSQTAGDSGLLDFVLRCVKEDYNLQNPQAIITSGVSGGLLLAFMALVNPGDEVIIADPYFVIYKHVIRMIGGRCVYVDSYPDFKLPVEKIAAAITDKTKIIILNSPANPTGAVYTEQEVRAIAQVAAEKDILVLSDEIYDRFCYDNKYVSIGNFYDNVLILKGFSKSYAMTGWRMGYAAGSERIKPVIEAMTRIQQYTFVCAPTPFQKAAVSALACDIDNYIQAYRKKRDLLYNGLKDKFHLIRPSGAFYAFVKAPSWAKSATEFVEKAIANNVLVIPGCVFSERDSHFRISYATTEEKILQGVEILCRLADGA